jgi:hypothetical protein
MPPLLQYPVSARVVPPPIRLSSEHERRSLGEDREILQRILAAYHHVRSEPCDYQDAMIGLVWGRQGFEGRQADLIRALEDRALIDLHAILHRYFLTDAAHALAMGRDEAAILAEGGANARSYSLQWLERLVGLAFAVGASPLPNPEDRSGRWEACLEAVPETVAAAIERKLGIPLVFPDVCGVFGGVLGERIIPLIAFQHLLVADHLRMVAPSARPRVVEIGGGFGGLAFFAARLLGGHWTIYDLPFMNAVQAYFLWRALPDTPLALAGELPFAAAGLQVLPAWRLFTRRESDTADVAVTQDSLIEVPGAVACRYLESVRCFLRGPFVSVNPDFPGQAFAGCDGLPVAVLIERVGGFRCVQRSPFFLRPGHLHEVFYPEGVQPSFSCSAS